MYSIFLIDDEENICQSIAYALKDKFRIRCFGLASDAREAIEETPPDILLLDIGLPDINGLDFLAQLKSPPPTIILTAFDDLPTVIKAMQRGANDYLIKPIQLAELSLSLERILESLRLKSEVKNLQRTEINENFPFIVGESDAIQATMAFVADIAQSPDIPVLICGESGTGKELIARAIHFSSPNRQGNFVAINCAAIPASLLESELFGYAKGAFSGADSQGRVGLVEEAANGSLFLDEIADMPFDLQAKLLRFIEEGEFYRLGDSKKRKIKTRIISASHQNLDLLIQAHKFRLDLYYRLAVVQVNIPSLNERPGDISLIARHFLSEFNEKYNKAINGFSPEALQWLESRHWVGNIRELRNYVERGVLISKGTLITAQDMGRQDSLDMAGKTKSPNSHCGTDMLIPLEGLNFSELEKSLIKQAYIRSNKNDRSAAALLGMSYHAYRYRRKQYFPD